MQILQAVTNEQKGQVRELFSEYLTWVNFRFEETTTLEEMLTFKSGTLWKRIQEQTDRALQCGALHSIATESEFIEQNGIHFLVRILSNLNRKDKAKKKQDKKSASSPEFNPFLPYEADLFVADISDTHLCLLNKYNVVKHHLLIVTRAFEEQDTWLTLADFQALWVCMGEFEGLAFYNGGKLAGASQRHKHLQIVPLPLISTGVKVPIEPANASATFEGMVGRIPSFPFRHAIARISPSWFDSPLTAARTTLECYHTLLQAVGLEVNGRQQSGAYNFLATREWMLVVPRSQESFQGISVNSLGFAGALLVRNPQQMQLLKEYGPMTVLTSVALEG